MKLSSAWLALSLNDDRSERQGHTSCSRQYLTRDFVSFSSRDRVPPLIPRLSSQHHQTAALQDDRLGPFSFDNRKLHDTLRPQGNGTDHRSEARDTIDVGRNALSGFVLVDDQLIWSGHVPFRNQPRSQ